MEDNLIGQHKPERKNNSMRHICSWFMCFCSTTAFYYFSKRKQELKETEFHKWRKTKQRSLNGLNFIWFQLTKNFTIFFSLDPHLVKFQYRLKAEDRKELKAPILSFPSFLQPLHSPRYHFIITISLADRCDWRDTRGKWPLATNPDRGWWHRLTSLKHFLWKPMAPWTPGNELKSILLFDCYHLWSNVLFSLIFEEILPEKESWTHSMAYETRRSNAAFTRAIQ